MSSERHLLGGEPFLGLDEGTVEHDLHFMRLVQRAGISEVTMTAEESAGDYARRLFEQLVNSGAMLPLLSCLIVPEAAVGAGQVPGDVWTPALAEETEAFLRGLRAPEDKAAIKAMILALLVSFFQSGIVSLWTTPTSCDPETDPPRAMP